MLKLLAIAFVTTGAGLAMITTPASPAFAATAEEQRACQDDAFRLCERAIPDEARVRACMTANVRKLSPGCRRFFIRQRRR
jgi:hypothetical protein